MIHKFEQPATPPLTILRKRAGEHCKALAKKLDEHPDDIWAEASKREYLPEPWNNEEGNDFWDAFSLLHRHEKHLLNSATISA